MTTVARGTAATMAMTARCQTFGDWGAPAACWLAWDAGGDRWAAHVKRCRSCAVTEASRKRGAA